MKIKTPTQFESFCDGVCDIVTPDGDNEPKVKYHLRYADRVVGIKRFYEAAAAQLEINAVIRVHQRRDITTHDQVLIGDKLYEIKQVQHINDALPPATDLSLRQISMHWM